MKRGFKSQYSQNLKFCFEHYCCSKNPGWREGVQDGVAQEAAELALSHEKTPKLVEREQIPLRDNGGLNKQLLNNKH